MYNKLFRNYIFDTNDVRRFSFDTFQYLILHSCDFDRPYICITAEFNMQTHSLRFSDQIKTFTLQKPI